MSACTTALLIPLALALAACGSGADSTQVPTTSSRLVPQAGVPGLPADLTVVQEFLLPENGLPAWELTGASTSAIVDEGPRCLELRGTAEMHVTLDLDVEPGTFNQVAVTVRPFRDRALRLKPGDVAEAGQVTPSQFIRRRDEAITVLYDLYRQEWTDDLSRSLTLTFSPPPRADGKRTAPIGLISVVLLNRPLARWLPLPGEPAELLVLEEEARRVVGITDQWPLQATFEVGDWAELSFTHGFPPVSFRPQVPHYLRLTVEDQWGAKVTRRLRSKHGWTSETVPLADLSGAATARLEVEMGDGGPGLLAVGELRLERARGDAPTVLLITSDTHRADHLAAMQLGVDVVTPTLDGLAARGMLFTDCVSSANVTHPSHVALMSGHPPRDTGVLNNADRVSDEPVMLAERFRAAGWNTVAAVGIGSLDHERSGLGQGFDRVLAPRIGMRDSAETIELLLEAVADSEGQPLFVWLHMFDAHTPYRDHPGLRELYYPLDRDPRSPELAELPTWQRANGSPEVRDLDYSIAMYRNEVTHLDAQLRGLLEHPRFRDGIIAFTADHGESLTEHQTWFTHADLYPQTLHIPLILAWPGGPSGVRVARPVEQIDLGHTLLELAGVGAGEFPGRNLVLDDAEPRPRFALGVDALSASVYADSWFLMLRLQDYRAPGSSGPARAAHSVELYDLSGDPACEHDLSEQEPAVARRLRGLAIDWLLAAPSAAWNTPQGLADADALAELAELGYTTEERTSTSTQWFDPDCGCQQCVRWE